MSNQPPVKTPPKSESKHYSFNADEFLYVSEKRAMIEVNDSLIRRFVASKVLPRLGIDTKKTYVRVSSDGQGIDCEPLAEVKA